MENRTCSVEDCESPRHVRGLCIKHYGRFMRHGSTDDPREPDYGTRSKHPLWKRWLVLRKRDVLCEGWRQFSAFIAGVGDPNGATKLLRLDQEHPFGPGNFRWARALVGEEKRAYHRAYNSENYPALREKRVQATYGLGPGDYATMLAAQHGGCAICSRPESEPTRRGGSRHKRLAVDHCHDSGRIRGLLCTDCNVGLGCFLDDPELFRKAIAYLEK